MPDMPLPGPYEILDMPDGGLLEIHPLRWDIGQVVIVPRDGRAPKVVRAARLHVSSAEKRTLPQYWDITAQTVIPTLEGVLPSVVQEGRGIRLQKHGAGPSARFTLDIF